MNDKVKILLDALKFYADANNYIEYDHMDISSKVAMDKGRKAKEAVEEFKKGKHETAI